MPSTFHPAQQINKSEKISGLTWLFATEARLEAMPCTLEIDDFSADWVFQCLEVNFARMS